MGSCHTDTGIVRGHIGIVPGTPEGPRGSTGRGHLSRRGSWAAKGKVTSPKWAGAPPPKGPCALGFGGTLKGAPPLLGGQAPSPLAAAPPPPPIPSQGGPPPPPP